MNKIRQKLVKEAEAFIPRVRETYRLIQTYQFSRTEENEIKLRLQLMRASREMQQFKPFLRMNWWAYFAIMENQERFCISDVICAFDCIIHQLHLRAGNRGVTDEAVFIDNLSPWNKEVKDFLNQRRKA
jgi:hypothetical protein